MRLEKFLNENQIISEGIFQKILKKIGNKSTEMAKKLFKENWIKLSSIIYKHKLESKTLAIINKSFGTKFKNLEDIEKMVIKEDSVNEDFGHYWKLIKDEGFPVLAFYPMLSVWMEIDKLLKGTGEGNLKVIIVYGLFWVFLVTGKHIKQFLNWKQSNPKEFEKEGGKKNPFSV